MNLIKSIYCSKKMNTNILLALKTSTMLDPVKFRQESTLTLWVTWDKLQSSRIGTSVASRRNLAYMRNRLPSTWVWLRNLSTKTQLTTPTSAINHQPLAVKRCKLSQSQAWTPQTGSKQNSRLKIWRNYPSKLAKPINAFSLERLKMFGTPVSLIAKQTWKKIKLLSVQGHLSTRKPDCKPIKTKDTHRQHLMNFYLSKRSNNNNSSNTILNFKLNAFKSTRDQRWIFMLTVGTAKQALIEAFS